MPKQCKARTRKGSRCPNAAGESGYCFTHDPNRKKERAAARKLGGLRRRRSGVSGEPVEIKTPADVLKLINSVIADAMQLDNSPSRARVLLQAASAASSALEAGELEERLEAVEATLKIGDAHEKT
jgi:hypothetical protein